MIILRIADKKYKYLTKQSEITLRIGNEITRVKKDYKCDCNPEFQKKVLAILAGTDYETADLVDEYQIAKIVGVHPFFANTINTSFKKFFKLKNKLYEYADFNKTISVKKYHDWDFLSLNDEDDALFMALFTEIKWWKKPFKYFLTKNIKEFNELNYFQYKLALFNYYMWKKALLEDYGLSAYNPEIPADQQPDEYRLTTLEKFSIFHTIMEYSDNNIKQWYFWLDKDIKELFRYLVYMNTKITLMNQKQQSIV